jgi:trehalose/maltose transport system substrate-binding protein
MSIRNRFAALLGSCAIAVGCAAQADTIAISCSALGKELALCKQGAEAWAKKTGHQVKLVSTPNASNERLALYQQLLAAKSPDIDVFQIDVIWPGLLGEQLADLKPLAGKAPAQHLPALIENDTSGRDALVYRCRAVVLPQRPAAKI